MHAWKLNNILLHHVTTIYRRTFSPVGNIGQTSLPNMHTHIHTHSHTHTPWTLNLDVGINIWKAWAWVECQVHAWAFNESPMVFVSWACNERLHRSPKFSCIYLIDYSSLPNNHKKSKVLLHMKNLTTSPVECTSVAQTLMYENIRYRSLINSSCEHAHWATVRDIPGGRPHHVPLSIIKRACIYSSTRLRKPRERVEFERQHLSEKVTCNF